MGNEVDDAILRAMVKQMDFNIAAAEAVMKIAGSLPSIGDPNGVGPAVTAMLEQLATSQQELFALVVLMKGHADG